MGARGTNVAHAPRAARSLMDQLWKSAAWVSATSFSDAAATVGWGVNPPYCVHDWLQGIASIFSALRAEIGMTGCWQGGSGYWMPAATVQLL